MKIRFTFKDGIHIKPGTCDREIHGNVVICSELSTNPGPSITNAAEIIAGLVCDRFAIPKAELIWIEHYDPSSHKKRHRDNDEWDLVTFQIEGREFTAPHWKPITKAQLQEILDSSGVKRQDKM